MSVRSRRWRANVVRRLPVALMVYPFECFIALLGLVLGASLLLGSIRPGSLFATLPPVAVAVYAVASVLGSGTVIAGLVHKIPLIMAVGLRLIAVLMTVYTVALVSTAGWKSAGFAAIFFGGIATLAGFRAFYLRAEADEVRAAHPREV